jgi:hypothetical protein
MFFFLIRNLFELSRDQKSTSFSSSDQQLLDRLHSEIITLLLSQVQQHITKFKDLLTTKNDTSNNVNVVGESSRDIVTKCADYLRLLFQFVKLQASSSFFKQIHNAKSVISLLASLLTLDIPVLQRIALRLFRKILPEITHHNEITIQFQSSEASLHSQTLVDFLLGRLGLLLLEFYSPENRTEKQMEIETLSYHTTTETTTVSNEMEALLILHKVEGLEVEDLFKYIIEFSH